MSLQTKLLSFESNNLTCLKVQVFWDKMLHHWVSSLGDFEGSRCLHLQHQADLQNTGNRSLSDRE